MKQMEAFIAYPYVPSQIRETITVAIKKAWQQNPSLTLIPWEANDVPGRCLVDPILERIVSCDFMVADISTLNFNVVYEIAYAIGRQKRVFLVKNRNVIDQGRMMREVGIFDTIGYVEYQNSEDLSKLMTSWEDFTPLPLQQTPPNKRSPVYLITPREKTEAEIRLISRLKKEARLFFRSFDPQENGRLSVRDAIDSVTSSLGVIVPLISENRPDANIHNLRCAFIAGLSHSTGIETLILQAGESPVPMDLRDTVSIYSAPEQIDRYLAEFAPRVTERLQQVDQVSFPELQTPINQLFLGASAAENEFLELQDYYLQTDEYQRVLRGEVQVIIGRKGSGKTALFFQVRNRVRSKAANVVVDLNPEGFQLRKLKTVILSRLEIGTREHTITAFWEYLLLLEVCHKLIENDRMRHLHDHTLREQYLELVELFSDDPYISEGDFAERMLRITEEVEDAFHEDRETSKVDVFLDRSEITNLLYKHDLPKLRKLVVDYLQHKEQVWILFDNIDKGWAARGVDELDLLSLRCLLDAFAKIKRDFRKRGIDFHGVTFIRNDVYELLVESMPDRGKIPKAAMDWADPELLRELLKRRFNNGLKVASSDFDAIWRSVAETHILGGQESSTYLLERCLMRPRALINLLSQCRSHAINLSHDKICESDFVEGEKIFSTDLVNQIGLEIHDVHSNVEDTLYALIEAPRLLDSEDLNRRLAAVISPSDVDSIIELLLWYGVLGILRISGEETYIYNVNYEIKKMNALVSLRPRNELVYVVNKAFWKGLDIRVD